MTDMFPTTITLKRGSHELPSEGSCAMEVAVLAAGYGWTEITSANDLPACMSRVIGAYVIRLNDAMPDDERQHLMRYVTRMSGTAASLEIERQRAEHLVMHAARPAVAAALASVELHDHATGVANAPDITALWAAAKAAAKAAALAAKNAARTTKIVEAWTFEDASTAAIALADAAWAWALAGASAAKSVEATEAAATAAEAAAGAVMSASVVVTRAPAEAAKDFDWSPYLAALDGALAIGPQADPIEVAVVCERVKMLDDAR